jgi:hypothetical protein
MPQRLHLTSSFYPEPETTISFAPYLINYSDRFTTFLYLIVWYGCLDSMGVRNFCIFLLKFIEHLLCQWEKGEGIEANK